MKKELDIELYKKYLEGDKEAFETLYYKYKNRLQYFIFNIVKDYQRAEDIVQEVFIYVMQHEIKEGYSFKYYLYLVAKSKALNCINTEKRRSEINEKYLSKESDMVEQDVSDIVMKKENKKTLIEAINTLDDKYKNAIYLTKIEEMSYKETADILGESINNVKTLVHRGKRNLRKILLKKGFGEMNKVLRVIIIVICTTLVLSGLVYAVSVIYKNLNKNHNITFNASYESTLDDNTINNLWIGTLDLAWKELEEKLGRKIELDENIEIADELNASTFTKDMISADDYTIEVNRTQTNGYDINATLNKNLNFLYSFDNFSNDYNYTFGKDTNSTEYIKYFGINNASKEELNNNVEVLFFNEISNNAVNNDFAVKLKTKEGDEIILYRTDENKSFYEYYNDIISKSKEFTGSTILEDDDELLIPYVRVNGRIAYNELFGRTIKNTDGMYISNVVQNVNFSLNESGANINSHSTMTTEYISVGSRYFWFKDKFIIFMKEANSQRPYFALKVDNSDILEKKEENDEPKIIDNTVIAPERYQKYLIGGEYKFYEDENYEYFYPSHRTEVVEVYFKDGGFMTVEEALKEGKISMDLLDKYGVEYTKKAKR